MKDDLGKYPLLNYMRILTTENVWTGQGWEFSERLDLGFHSKRATLFGIIRSVQSVSYLDLSLTSLYLLEVSPIIHASFF